MAEGEDVVLLSEEQEEWEDEVKKLLDVIEKRPAGSRNASSAPEPKEGYLLKKKRKSNKWQKYFFVINPSTGRLTYYSSREVRSVLLYCLASVCHVACTVAPHCTPVQVFVLHDFAHDGTELAHARNG